MKLQYAVVTNQIPANLKKSAGNWLDNTMTTMTLACSYMGWIGARLSADSPPRKLSVSAYGLSRRTSVNFVIRV